MPDLVDKPAARVRVLTIEDSPETRLLIRRILEPKGFEVLEASDGLAGIDLALAHPPDLILCDIALPGISGYETSTRLRSHKSLDAVPIVVLTSAGDRSLALSVGADGFIQKPIEVEKFPGQLRAYLEGKREKLRVGDERRHLREYSQSLTERLEQTVRELTLKNAQLLTAMRAKQEFMQNLSHELATPLTPVIGYVKMLRSLKLGPLTEPQGRALESMNASVERLSRAIDNLVDFATLEGGEGLLQKEPFDIAEACKAALEEMKNKAKARRVHLELKIAPATIAFGDSKKLKQALVNLLDNAVKFGPVGGEVMVHAFSEHDRLLVEVYDQGTGVLPDEADKVFEPFFHADRGDDKAPGAGLGLPVAKQIVEAHGGNIRVESPPKTQPESGHFFSGAKVWFWVPLPKAA
ncbi:MAG: hybrid sensor histidine kinase/response regulator [Deltaproteobacteria bacterium]|nr:hybrid sensor histidine kinase/response regulator [Deltaproteobacteria bacterium]